MAQIGKWKRQTEEPAPILAPVIPLPTPAPEPQEQPDWLNPNKVPVPIYNPFER